MSATLARHMDVPSPSPTPPRPRLATPSDPDARRVLVVDDEMAIRDALARYFTARGYEVHTAASADEALHQLQEFHFALALCDVRMPGMTGVEMVPHALALDPDLAVVMLTAVNDAPTATEALAGGAVDYLVKPVELPALQFAVERALHRRALVIEQRNVERLIREEVAQRTAELEQEKAQLREVTFRVTEALVNAMEARDVFLRGHSQRVGVLAAAVAEELELHADVVEQVRLAGKLHDVGKIGISESVLNKPGSLTPEEYAHVKDHVRVSVEILSPLQHIGDSLRFVADHHERWDGSGYPKQLVGEAISIGGRIIAACDSYDAMTSQRAYRGAMDRDAALTLVESFAGKLLDPAVVRALQRVVKRNQALVFIDEVHG